MTTMLEKMAKAIYERAAQGARDDQNGDWVSWDGLADELEWNGKRLWVEEARAALQAIREPDFDMHEAGEKEHREYGHASDIYRAMIDAILNEKGLI